MRRLNVGHAAQGGDQATARATDGAGDGERVHERQTEPAAVGGGAPTGRDRDADLRRLIGRVQRRGQRAQSRVLHLNTRHAHSPEDKQLNPLRSFNSFVRWSLIVVEYQISKYVLCHFAAQLHNVLVRLSFHTHTVITIFHFYGLGVIT